MSNKPMTPVLHTQNYGRVDGRQAGRDNETTLAMGLADGPAVSVGDGDPMPLHRVLDSAIFTLSAMAHLRESYRYPQGYDPQKPAVARIGLQGDAMSITVNDQAADIAKQIMTLSDAVSRDGDMLGERLRVLKGLLEDLGY